VAMHSEILEFMLMMVIESDFEKSN